MPLKSAKDDPNLLPIAPILYTTWADGILDDVEVAALATCLDALPASTRKSATVWLDPQTPPTATELAQLLTTIREGSTGSPGSFSSLVALGEHLARGVGQTLGGVELEALRALEAALGIDPADAVRELLAPAPESETAEAAASPQTISLDALTRWLDADQHEQIAAVRELIAELGPPPVGMPIEAHRARISDQVVELADRGLAKLAYPGVTTGHDGLARFLATFETLGFSDVSLLVKFGVQYGLFGGSIYFLGSQEQREHYLPDVAAGKLMGCFAMTETGHGSNVMRLGTVARYDHTRGDIEITTEGEAARKDYIGNAARDARLATVFAQLEVDGVRHGVHAFLVPIRDSEGRTVHGVRIGDDGHKLGLLGVDNGRLWFDGVRVSRDSLLSRFARIDESGTYQSEIASPNKRFFTMLSTLVGGRVSIAAAAVSSAKVGLSIAVRYADRRKQFGAGDKEEAILDYTSHLRRLMPRLAKTYACHAAVRYLQARYLARTDDDAREVESLAAGIKAYATWHNTDTLQECRECCGGAGYLAENRIGPLAHDTDVFTTFEGDNTVLMLLVARSMLGAFKAQFHDSRTFAVIKLIARRAMSELTEKNPVATRRTSAGHLDDRDFQQGALRYREDSLVRSVAMRMKKRIDGGKGAFSAQNEVQPHLLAAARAHVERVVLEQFYLALDESGTDGETRAALSLLVDLYALSAIEEDAAWFLEQGYIEASKFKAIRKRVTSLCRELRPYARALVDGFAIPEPCIGAPIATQVVPPADPREDIQ